MTVNKLALNKISEDFLNIELELLDTLDHDTSKEDIDNMLEDVSESLRQHLFFLVKQRIDENAKLKKNVFSNFSKSNKVEQASTSPVELTKVAGSSFSTFSGNKPTQVQAEATFEDVTLIKTLSALKKAGVLSDAASYLPNVYRFTNSAYAYNITATEWSSPFGSYGVDSLGLINDISKNILKYSEEEHKAFLLKLALLSVF